MWKLASSYSLSLSLSLPPSLPPSRVPSNEALLSNSRSATASSHSLGDFLSMFFFSSSVLGCRCYCVVASSRSAFFELARSTRNARRILDRTIRQRGFFLSVTTNGDSIECYVRSLKFLGNANARREDPEGIQRRGNCVSRYEICRRTALLGWSVVLPSFV